MVAGGCNAHGFKHASGLGEALADLAMGREPRLELGFLAPGRFGATTTAPTAVAASRVTEGVR